MQYRREIDGLRAVAVVPVILFHAGLENFSGGFIGVDIFFVISGYLITTILMAEMESGRFSITRFYERRARRILPALFLVMLCCIPFAWLWMLPSQMEAFSKSLAAVALFGSNILFWREEGYFAATADLKPLLHTWSLAVEEQFYVVFPIALLVLRRLAHGRLIWVLAAVAVLSLGVSEWGWRNSPDANFYLAPSRAWELLTGSICALLLMQPGTEPRSSNLFSLAGMGLIVFSIFYFDDETPFPSIYALLPVVGTALIILFGSERTWIAKVLGFPVFVGIGLISYSAYLWHQPLFAFARIRSGMETDQTLLLVLAAASFALATASWHFVERPFRQGPQSLLTTRRAVFGFSAAISLGFIAFGAYGVASGGISARATERLKGDVGHLEFHKYIAEHYHPCEPAEVAAAALSWDGFLRCAQSRPKAPITVLLLGDSHAENLYLGVAEAMKDENVGFYILDGAAFVSNPAYARIIRAIQANSSIQTVILSMHWSIRMDQVPPSSHLRRELSETITHLQKLGKKVILIDDVPKFQVDAESCKLRVFTSDLTGCTRAKSDILDYEQDYARALDDAASQTEIPIYRLRDLFCDQTRCAMFKGSTILYRDSNHLNIPGSLYAGKYLADRMRETTSASRVP